MADLEEESNETFQLQLDQPVGAVLGDTSTTRVTISDSACNVIASADQNLDEEDTIYDRHCYTGDFITRSNHDYNVKIEPGVSFFLQFSFSVSGGGSITAV